MIPSMKSFDDIMTEDPEEDAMTSGNDVYPGEATKIGAKIMRLHGGRRSIRSIARSLDRVDRFDRFDNFSFVRNVWK